MAKWGRTRVVLRYVKSTLSSSSDSVMSLSYVRVRTTLELEASGLTASTVTPVREEDAATLGMSCWVRSRAGGLSVRRKVFWSSSWVKGLEVVPGSP